MHVDGGHSRKAQGQPSYVERIRGLRRSASLEDGHAASFDSPRLAFERGEDLRAILGTEGAVVDADTRADLAALGYATVVLEGTREGNSLAEGFRVTAWRSGFDGCERGFPHERAVLFGIEDASQGHAVLDVIVRNGTGPLLHARIEPRGVRNISHRVTVSPLMSLGGAWVAVGEYVASLDPEDARMFSRMPLVARRDRWAVTPVHSWDGDAPELPGRLGNLVRGMVETLEDPALRQGPPSMLASLARRFGRDERGPASRRHALMA